MNELAVQQGAAMVPAQPNHYAQSPAELLSLAVQQGNTAMIDTLAHHQRVGQEKAEEAAFNRAMHSAQGEMRRIGADAQNPQTRSKYLTYAKLDGALRPIYTKHGFSVSFNTQPGATPDVLNVLAYVSHEDGHTRPYMMPMPADGKGAKGNDVMTRTHATGAAASYGMRYLLKMIFNVAVGETDDDGNGASGKVGEGQMIDYLSAIEAATNLDELKAVYAPAYRFAQGANDREAMQSIRKSYERRKGAL